MKTAAIALPSPIAPTLMLTSATPSSWQLASLPYDPMGRDRNCSAFATHTQAQAFTLLLVILSMIGIDSMEIMTE